MAEYTPENTPSTEGAPSDNKNKGIKFTKNIVSNQEVVDKMDLGFSELAESSVPVDEESILNDYDNVFYNMKVSGDHSHKALVNKIYDHVNYAWVTNMDRKIIRKSDEVVEKENELMAAENPGVNNPPGQIYEDGSYLIAGENGVKYPEMDTVYIMQEGRKRAIASADIFRFVIRRAAGLPEDFSGKYYVSFTEINNIPDGPTIHTLADLNIKGDDLKVDLPPILGASAFVDVQFYCAGNEVSDYSNSAKIIADVNNIEEMQFYLDNDPCIIKYIDDQYVNDEYGPTVATKIFERGETVTLRLLRRSTNALNNVPSDMDQYYQEGLDIQYNNNSFINYIRQWGPGQLYDTVVYASGRIKSKQVPFAETLQISQDNLSWEIFNGLPTENTGIWAKNPDITLITAEGYTGQELSDYGTRMIYKQSGLWGALGQASDLQSDVFDKPDSPYYHTTFYGQPIVRYDNDWCIIWYTYKSAGKRFRLYRLNDRSAFGKKRQRLEDSMGLHMDLSGNDILGIRWDTLHKDRVRYPGLQEYQTKEWNGLGNYFNPTNGGNNYKKVSANTFGQ
tara:strand:- start:627 stop:2315 length:1689 start_codon:yes stop_codon:yes gene_type:complete